MTWRITKVEQQRKDFIDRVQGDTQPLAELCREFDISRKTAYKWLERYEKEGLDGLKDRNRAPHHQKHKTSEEVIAHIIALKRKRKSWGPKKIKAWLGKDSPLMQLPSTTTIGNILEQHGLIIPRKYRRRYAAKANSLSYCLDANDVWCVDFKGWFITKDAVKCEPLTLTDAHSRYILYCNKLRLNCADYVWDILDKAFDKYGLPIYLRHDNGPPFATLGAGRLSRLSVKLIKAGVIPEWIEPGKPYQNGRHERMHLTLKNEAVFPLRLTLHEQQLKFAEFLEYYNHERPHEALGQKTPGSVYRSSTRTWTGKLKNPEYGSEYRVKRIRGGGQLAWYGTDIQIGKTLEDEYVGLKENEDGEWSIYFGPVFLGTINHEKKFEQPQVCKKRSSHYKCVIF